jgi:hypothetical protein
MVTSVTILVNLIRIVTVVTIVTRGWYRVLAATGPLHQQALVAVRHQSFPRRAFFDAQFLGELLGQTATQPPHGFHRFPFLFGQTCRCIPDDRPGQHVFVEAEGEFLAVDISTVNVQFGVCSAAFSA